ncbi:hypothetical protein JL101_029580 (plasmid) [Skermanella rosea]|uniref:hypothetical protein n=1 Tax=Skermanella rosea TaxID=1817965 RepID=UPI0019346240|nr:hypothetical protein [Skermanella rosea]UEM07149.1 hypothetical protein JL101_029580 [Skermanella rosea]
MPALGFGVPLAELACSLPGRTGDPAETARFEEAVRGCWSGKSPEDRLVVLSAFGRTCRHETLDEYAPLDYPDLYREFAALPPTVEAVRAFAGRTGSLAFGEAIVPVDAGGTPIGPAEADRAAEGPEAGRWPLVHGEPVSLWRDEAFALGKCLEIDAILRSRDVGAMREFVGIGEETFSWRLSREDRRKLLRQPADKTSFLPPEVRWRQLFGPGRKVPSAARTHGNEVSAL